MVAAETEKEARAVVYLQEANVLSGKGTEMTEE